MMVGYFQPLRRKLGVVTLVLTCVFAAGWVRSEYAPEQFWIGSSAMGTHQISSHSSRILWLRRERIPYDEHIPFWDTLQDDYEFPNESIIDSIDIEREFQLIGFRFLRVWVRPSELLLHFWTIPYWSIVLPLILLSAWLLLSKPRAGKIPSKSPPKTES